MLFICHHLYLKFDFCSSKDYFKLKKKSSLSRKGLKSSQMGSGCIFIFHQFLGKLIVAKAQILTKNPLQLGSVSSGRHLHPKASYFLLPYPRAKKSWILAMTSPALPGIWIGLQSCLMITMDIGTKKLGMLALCMPILRMTMITSTQYVFLYSFYIHNWLAHLTQILTTACHIAHRGLILVLYA